MKIHFIDGTLRYENDAGESWAWPIYMGAPVQNDFVDAILPALKDFEAKFDTESCTLTVEGKTLGSDADVSGYSQEVQVFHSTVFGFGHYAEIARLKEKEQRGTVYKTRTVMKEQEPVVEMVYGKAVLKQRDPIPVEEPVESEIPVVDESGNPVIDPKTKRQAMHKVPIVDEEKSFTEAERVRLETLTAKEAESVRTR